MYSSICEKPLHLSVRGFLFLPRYMTNSREERIEFMTNQEIIKKLRIIKITCDIDNQFIADYLGMRNARSVANFLHNDYCLSAEKRRKAEELISDLWVEV